MWYAYFTSVINSRRADGVSRPPCRSRDPAPHAPFPPDPFSETKCYAFLLKKVIPHNGLIEYLKD